MVTNVKRKENFKQPEVSWLEKRSSVKNTTESWMLASGTFGWKEYVETPFPTSTNVPVADIELH